MLLTLDIGNTHIVVGLFEGPRLAAHWRLMTDRNRTSDELRLDIRGLLGEANVDGSRIVGIAVSSVVPSLNQPLLDGLGAFSDAPIRFLSAANSPILLHVDDPRSVGADRIANCIGAHHLIDGPALVIDFGTAVTFDLVSETGAFLGGAIAPEMLLAARALFDRAAQLHAVVLDVPPSVVGKTTEANLQAGIVLGFLDLVDGLIKRFRREVDGALTVISTGGRGKLFAEQLSGIETYVPFLTVDGLRLWWEDEPATRRRGRAT
ncbi:type III pantothenate kinase [Candidatus Bipolaricaulota bacterium]|nr:type III pantothenate kinase [Candidatus Bipolaricaulota bacterium]